ncbi:cell envelope biogenesis protein OmpA [Terasakiispira papahanaumokuakeensis]|uniref:Cell envelope biogenesis protein OmpA n=1 Tax=Terasakiispira papahanaumokuakeensis TaxID=197479 RepID=A0A1E2VB10_9GAMM|nr:OmpA family protein [Terasakiispira papahanaumokuakeensis]ODC04200.1 cell envelope biogenesis protein OmpA [Terasakiispira papahanaumokuakeensis]
MNPNLQDEDPLAGEEGAHWISVSDLMAGLMMVFLLLAVVFMVIVQHQNERVRQVAEVYVDLREALYQDLLQEFKDDLPRWGAELRRDLSIRFNDSGGLFELGSAELRPEFAEILADFFPRYIRIITSPKYRDEIAEVRIEGHTSSDWTNAKTQDDAYINNMQLSQHRTRSTLAYLLQLQDLQIEKSWLKHNVTANGLSSSKPLLTAAGTEDEARSRRVEFRVRTDADARIREILQEMGVKSVIPHGDLNESSKIKAATSTAVTPSQTDQKAPIQ